MCTPTSDAPFLRLEEQNCLPLPNTGSAVSTVLEARSLTRPERTALLGAGGLVLDVRAARHDNGPVCTSETDVEVSVLRILRDE